MQDLAEALRVHMLEHDLSQQQLAMRSGVSQATVSRALRAIPERRGRARHRLFTYARINDSVVDPSQRKGAKRVEQAFRRIWDGSEAHAEAVAKIIHALEGLRPSLPDKEESA